jgi:hypothetical protein
VVHYLPNGQTASKSKVDISQVCVEAAQQGLLQVGPEKIVCIDWCTNSRRLEREKTISLTGAKLKKFSAAKATNTNTYMVAVCREDEGQYPALTFTHDPAFDSNGPHAAEVQRWFDEMDIKCDHVIYVAGGKKYIYESSAMIAHFKNMYRQELAGT